MYENCEPEWGVLGGYAEWGNVKFECEVHILYKFLLVFEGFSVEYEHRKSKDDCEIQECMKDVDRKKRRGERYRSPDDRLDIERFEIRKHHHQKFAEIEECLISWSERHIGYGRDGVADDIYSHDEEYGEKRRYESRKEKDDSEEEEKFQIDEPYWNEEEEGEWNLCYEEYHRRYDGLYEDDKEKDGGESEKFPEYEISSDNRFREDQVDGFSFNLPEEELASDENDRDDAEYLHHSESEIRYDLIGLSEREGRKHQREPYEGDPEEYDHIEDLVPSKFPESIEGDIEHTCMEIGYKGRIVYFFSKRDKRSWKYSIAS